MSEKKKLDTKALLEKSRSVKQKPQGSLLERKLKNKKNGAKFGKVNFNGYQERFLFFYLIRLSVFAYFYVCMSNI